MFGLPLLSSVIFLPVLGILILFFIPKDRTSLIRSISVLATFLTLVISILILANFNIRNPHFQLEEKLCWIPQINVNYHLGVDGLSYSMVFLTALLSFLACIGSFSIKERIKEYFIFYLLLEVGMMGTFLALDLFLFYVFWEITLVPMYFLIGIWGGPRKEYAAIKFFLYTLAGSVFMLLGMLALYFNSSPHTFSIVELIAQNSFFAKNFQNIIFVALFFGFAIKVPIFPFHTWLPDAHVEAPTPASVLLAGVLLKMGGYGFFRISYPILPEAAKFFAPAMAVLALISIVYGAFVAMAQTDFKKMVAYSSVSHMGFVVLGLAALTPIGFSGAALQMFNHGIITGAMFLLVGVLYDRAHTRDLNAFGGIRQVAPVFSGILIFFSLASLGLPGLSGFVSEFLSLLGAFNTFRLFTIISVIGIVITAGYILYMLQRLLLGPLNEKWKNFPEINTREIITLVPLLIIVLALGVYPRIALDIINPALNQILTCTGALLK
jgi:NADH-quinone oxidoreductase subunit M